MFLSQDLRKTARSVVDISVHECAGVCILRPASHSAVFIPQPFHSMYSECLGRCHGFLATTFYESLTWRKVGWTLAVISIRGDDEHHSMTLCCSTRNGSAGGDALVIGVSMHADKCSH
jgi:hypothetical protein